MDDTEYLGLELDYWDETVGAFEPQKVIGKLREFFATAEIDPTDHQQVRLLRELWHWEQIDCPPEQLTLLIRQSWGNYQTSGPTYRFSVTFPSGHEVQGWARRMSVYFDVPNGLPAEHREQLFAFLRSLRLGEPTLAEPE